MASYLEPATSSYTVLDDFNGQQQLLSGTPSIFLMGARQSGKSSIEQVVFHKMEPHQTLYSIQPTSEIHHAVISHNELIKFQILDFPGSFDFAESEFKPSDFFKHCSVLLFVIDAQDRPYKEALNYIIRIIEMSYSINKNIQYDMLINKIDAEAFFTSESKLAILRAIEQTINERLDNLNLLNNIVNISYHLTSIYDHSIFEASSKIVQKLLPLPVFTFLKNILTSFVVKCDIEKAFVFDVVSKIYIATDANLMDTETIALCSDMIDVTVDVSGIYGHSHNNNNEMMNGANGGGGGSGGFDNESNSLITLQANKQSILTLQHVGKYLALVCIMKKPKNKGLFEYNVKCFRKAMNQLFVLLQKAD